MSDNKSTPVLRDVARAGENTSKNQLNLGLGTGEHLVYIMDHAGISEMDQTEMTPEEKIRLVEQREFGDRPTSDAEHMERAEYLADAVDRRVDKHEEQSEGIQSTTVWKSQYERIGKMYYGDELQAVARTAAIRAMDAASRTPMKTDDASASAKMEQATHIPRMPEQIYDNGIALEDFVDDTLEDYSPG